MKKLIMAVLAACLSMAVAGSYAAEDAMKKDGMKKSDAGMAKSEKGMDKKGDAMSKDDDKKKKGKGKKDEPTPK